MATNPDFKELFAALCDAGAEFLVVGAHAVMFHTVPRYTKDLDIWVRPTRANAERVLRALVAFGAPLAGLTEQDLTTPGTIFQMGVAPNRVDILTGLDGVSFDDAYARRATSPRPPRASLFVAQPCLWIVSRQAAIRFVRGRTPTLSRTRSA